MPGVELTRLVRKLEDLQQVLRDITSEDSAELEALYDASCDIERGLGILKALDRGTLSEIDRD